MSTAATTAEARPLARSAAPAWVFLGVGVIAMAGYVLVPALALPIVVLVPAVSLVAMVVGTRRIEQPTRRRPWYALTAGMFGFYGGQILRLLVPGATANPPGLASFIPDLLVVPGYLLVGYALREMSRRRGGTTDKLAGADALLAGLAAGVAVWSLSLAPRLAADHFTVAGLAVAAFPVVDAVLVVLVIRLMAADGVRLPALWLLIVVTNMVLILDVLYVVYEGGDASPTLLGLFDLGLILGFVAAGAAACHPTMRTLSEPQRVTTRPLGAARLLGLIAAVVLPAVLAYLEPVRAWWDGGVRTVLAVLFALVIVARLGRSQASQAHAEAMAQHRATHDALTDLPNRELLTDTITSWCDRAVVEDQQISMILVDLDRFKQINDHWGHSIGDELLCAVAGRLSAMVRSEDLVCRIGGDEFVIALASPSHSALVESLAERLVDAFRDPFPLSVGDVVVTSAIGVAKSSGAAQALELIRDADLAMYQAKDTGGNTFVLFDPSLRDRARSRIEIEQALRGALGRGELSVNYQPIVTVDEELSGFEALMRWTHPELGFVSPDKFIPVAEETGLIIASGAWLLNEAVDQLARWRRDRALGLPDLHISINVSTRQLREPGLVDVVRAALQRTDLPGSALWLEITESALMRDPEVALATLAELRGLGVMVAIDDFGTGYASLAYVQDLSADIVKVDKRFVDGLGKNTGDESIVLAVIGMAHGVGQRVVAEGVETAAQRDWLAAHNCDLLQGWLYGQARPAAAQDAWALHRMPQLVPAGLAR